MDWIRRSPGRAALVGILAFLCLCICVLGAIGGASRSGEVAEEPTASPGPSSTPLPPTATLPPTETLTPVQALRAAIEEALGDNNRDLDTITSFNVDPSTGEIAVRWPLNDNLGAGLRNFGAQADVEDILRAVDSSGLDYTLVHAQGTFSMADNFGNVSEDVVVDVTYNRETVERINWQGFLTENVYEIADLAIIHPEFR